MARSEINILPTGFENKNYAIIFLLLYLTAMIKKVEVVCAYCNKQFNRSVSKYNQDVKKDWNQFCSKECHWLAQNKRKQVVCAWCNTTFIKEEVQIKKTKHNFCSRSCSASYSNRNKTKGNRRSKLEIWLESQLSLIYPNLEIHYNRKDAINAELDIHIPSIDLAIELNGIFHYEPIYGENKLSQIQNNDERKFQACLENGIELCIIDTSGFTYFKVDKAQKYLQIVTQVINNKLAHFKI
ncbi:hypothetical protein [Kamptonema sp. UHCC 0994]|uniref:hypothetical protein n=1 Tax=Kamptonema sp. UHCC 0994 TaxID=3031329 RepID=UPI0023B97C20|nr:hypothetical protein [Kamptonema sp. UHCC 0994]MDF0552678.1 hypothetical protein [Kamptonema sp. UHCC 0994]